MNKKNLLKQLVEKYNNLSEQYTISVAENKENALKFNKLITELNSLKQDIVKSLRTEFDIVIDKIKAKSSTGKKTVYYKIRKFKNNEDITSTVILKKREYINKDDCFIDAVKQVINYINE